MKKEFDNIFYIDKTCNQECWFYCMMWETPGTIKTVKDMLFQASQNLDTVKNAVPGKGNPVTTYKPYYSTENTLEKMNKFHNSI